MIPVNTPLLNGNEKKYLAECIDSGWISSEGPFVERLEQGMCNIASRKHGIAVCNGTVALDIAVAALKIGPGDEVIVPSLAIISCAAAIVRAGASPVFVDSDPLTWNMDPEQVAGAVTSRTKAIMVVHTYGLPVDMDPILDIAKKNNLLLIEDAAEMHGQSYRGRACGSFGQISTFSFYPNKHITTGEGGMVLTDDPNLAERCRSLRNLCFQKRRFYHEELGWNGRMSNLQAAVGVAQIERFSTIIERKRSIGNLYHTLLNDCPNVQLPVQRTEYAENIYWVFALVLDDNLDFEAAHVMKKLEEQKIGTRPFFWPLHEQPIFSHLPNIRKSLPHSSRLARRGFYLPSGLGITDSEIQEVCSALRLLL